MYIPVHVHVRVHEQGAYLVPGSFEGRSLHARAHPVPIVAHAVFDGEFVEVATALLHLLLGSVLPLLERLLHHPAFTLNPTNRQEKENLVGLY